jgi:uncharacterized protein (TIGR03000 family)
VAHGHHHHGHHHHGHHHHGHHHHHLHGGVWPGASFFPYRYGFGYAPGLGFGYANRNFALSVGFGNAGLYRGYYGYPGDYGYNYPGPLVVNNTVPLYVPYYVPVPSAPRGDVVAQATPPAAVQSNYPPGERAPVPASAFGTARLTVQVPAGAKLWFDDKPTTQTGAVREFVTPPSLEQGRKYRYTIRGQWEENGQPVTREKTVELQAGSSVIINLNTPDQP